MTLSVILCAHNPREGYLSRALGALRAQTLPLTEWEFLLVDNASVAPLAERFDVSWHPRGRHVREDEFGLTPARLRGIRETSGELIVFVDDDNVLAPDYLASAKDIAHNWPRLGAWGGHIEGEFETVPAEWTRQYLEYICVRPCGAAQWSNNADDWSSQPAGAGLCVRRVVATRYRERLDGDVLRRMLGRNGASLMSGEDIDLVHCALELDLGFGRFPELKLTHLISAGRLEESYLLRLVRSVSCSSALLGALRGKPVRLPSAGLLAQLSDLKLLLESGRRALRFRQQQKQGVREAARILSKIETSPIPD